MPRKTQQKPASSTTFGPEASVTTYTLASSPPRWSYHALGRSLEGGSLRRDGKYFATIHRPGRCPLNSTDVKQLLDALNGSPSSSITVTWTADSLAGPKVRKTGKVIRHKNAAQKRKTPLPSEKENNDWVSPKRPVV